MRAVWLAALSVMAAAPPAQAQNITVIGAGTISCGQWTERRKEPDGWPSIFLVSWVLGYLTAMNQTASLTHNLTAGTDTAGVAAWIDNYCGTHPLDHVAEAATALAQELRNREPKS